MKHYIVYSSQISLKPDSAHEIHDVMCANAVANLGYSTVLVYPDSHKNSQKQFAWISPFQPRQPEADFVDFYNVQEKLKVAPLPIPQVINQLNQKWANESTLICRYYFPFHIRPLAQVIHTRSWNFVKTAINNKIATVYERHYFQEQPFEAEIVNSPYFKVAVTQSEPIRESLVKAGMPPEKAIWLDNGFSPSFLVRQPQEAAAWRQELLQQGREHLVIYSGALYRFKGIDMLIDVAKLLPRIQFAVTGGTEEQVETYRQLAKEKQVENINFLGWILPRSRLISLLQAADILAHPHSAGKAADFTNPVKFFQYMASGTPIVATEILPLMPFKSSPMIAFWCEPDNPTAFAQSIQQVLQKYPRKVEGYLESIEFARQFTWEERAKKILSYASCCNPVCCALQ